MEIRLLELMAKNKIRHNKHLSQLAGVSELTIHNILNNKNKGMRMETMIKLCKALNCTIDELIVIEN